MVSTKRCFSISIRYAILIQTVAHRCVLCTRLRALHESKKTFILSIEFLKMGWDTITFMQVHGPFGEVIHFQNETPWYAKHFEKNQSRNEIPM